jgi:hypothetical protein
MAYDPAADPVHGSGWNSAARWGGWSWSEPARGEHFRRCSFCGSIHPGDLAAETAGTGTCTICSQQGWEACFRAQKAPWMTDDALAGLDISDEERARVDALNPAHSYGPGGWYASWADRKYGWPHKFYVEGLRNRDPGALFCVGSSSEAREGPYAPGGEMYRPLSERYPGQNWVAAADLTPEQQAIIERDRMGGSDHYLFGTRPTHHAKFYTIHLADPAISQDVKDKIQQASGLRFTFTDDGRVGWEPWAA